MSTIDILSYVVSKLVKRKKAFTPRDVKLITFLLNSGYVITSWKSHNREIKYKKTRDRDEFSKQWLSHGLWDRVLKECHPNCKEKFIKNFLFRGIFKNSKLRDKIIKEGSYTPATVLISPTMRCNYRCAGCYAQNYTRNDDMSYEFFEKIIRDGEKIGVVFYTLLGGEPLLVFDMIYDIFKKYNDKIYAQIFTNGALINDEIAKKLQELGNIFVQFSIEGFEEETDWRRGKGAFKKVMEGMETCQKYGIPHGFSVCYTKKNAEITVSDKFINLMIDKGCLWGWYFLYMPVFGENADISLMPTAEQRELLWKRHLEIRRTKPIIVIDFWGDAPLVGGCIAGKGYVHVNHRGDVEPCIFTHFTSENIKNKSLKEIMASPFFSELRKMQPYSQNLLLPCMLIDHPSIIRRLVKKFNLHPTHPGAEKFITELAEGIDSHARVIHTHFDHIWKKHYDSSYQLNSCPHCYGTMKETLEAPSAPALETEVISTKNQ